MLTASWSKHSLIHRIGPQFARSVNQPMFEIIDEPVDLRFPRVPGAHEPATPVPMNMYDFPDRLSRRVDHLSWQAGKDGVRRGREKDLHP
jgi:hypothetical protein